MSQRDDVCLVTLVARTVLHSLARDGYWAHGVLRSAGELRITDYTVLCDTTHNLLYVLKLDLPPVQPYKQRSIQKVD